MCRLGVRWMLSSLMVKYWLLPSPNSLIRVHTQLVSLPYTIYHALTMVYVSNDEFWPRECLHGTRKCNRPCLFHSPSMCSIHLVYCMMVYSIHWMYLCVPVVFDDGDERTLKRSSLCLKGGRHFDKSEVSSLISSHTHWLVTNKRNAQCD